MPNEQSTTPDKEQLYGEFQKSARWRDRLHRKLSHKALDIADDEDVYVDNSRRGMGWKELVVLAVMLLGLGGGGVYMLQQMQQSPGAATDSEYEVRFYDADGKPIEVPHVSRRQEG